MNMCPHLPRLVSGGIEKKLYTGENELDTYSFVQQTVLRCCNINHPVLPILLFFFFLSLRKQRRTNKLRLLL